MNITVHVTWPIHMDYPIWRYQMKKYKKFIQHGIVSLSDNHETDNYSTEIKSLMGELGYPTFDPPVLKDSDDWRNKAIRSSLNAIQTEWVWFTEQDFIIRNERFFELVEQASHDCDFFAYEDQHRLHPACLFVKRELLEKTSRNFSPIVDKFDHFYTFTQELKEKAHRWGTLDDWGLLPYEDFYHMTGLTHNYRRIKEGLEPTKKDEFITYNWMTIPIKPYIRGFRKMTEKYLEKTMSEGYVYDLAHKTALGNLISELTYE